MITGIGTPNSQSKIPRPIVSSMNLCMERERNRERDGPAEQLEAENNSRRSLGAERAAAIGGTFYGFGISESESPVLKSE
jgi:hypothetical protein